MPTKTLNFNTLAAASPASPPTGYTQTAGSSNVNIVDLSATKFFSGVSSSSNSIWRDDTPLTGAVRSAFVTTGLTNGSAVGPALLDAGNDGYVALTSDGTGNTRLFLIVDSQLGAQVGSSITNAHADQQVREIRWETGGTISLWDGATQIGTNFTNTTYTPVYAAALSRGGRLRSMSSYYLAAFSIDTLTDPLVPGASVTGTETGFSDGAITANFGGLTIAGTVSGVSITGTMSSFVDGGLCPLLPAAAVSGTFTQGANTASITRAITVPVVMVVPPVGGAAVPTQYRELRDGSDAPANFAGLVLGDSKYLGQAFVDGGNPLTTADRVYFNPAYGFKIYQDGKVELNGTDHATNPVPSLPYTTTLWIRRGADGRMYSHDLTINEPGGPVVVTGGGLAMTGLTMSGLTMSGLTMSGM